MHPSFNLCRSYQKISRCLARGILRNCFQNQIPFPYTHCFAVLSLTPRVVVSCSAMQEAWWLPQKGSAILFSHSLPMTLELWCSPARCSFERHPPQSESQTHPRWCSPKRDSLKRHSPQCEPQTHPRWCSPERCSFERHGSQCESQTHPRRCSPEMCTQRRHHSQSESQTHPRWCSPKRDSLKRHSPQCEPQTHPRWCSLERCIVQRHRSQHESQTHPRWCSPERCSFERHGPQCESQTQGLWAKLSDVSFGRQSVKYWSRWKVYSPQNIPLYWCHVLLRLPLRSLCMSQSLGIQHPRALLRQVSQHHLWLSCRAAAPLWGLCAQLDLDKDASQGA